MAPAEPSDPVDDGALVTRLAAGDRRALADLITRHGSRVANFLGHVLHDRSWADDLTQEVFVRLCDRAASFDPQQSLPVWLLRIARNLAVDLMRREDARRRAHRRLGARTEDDVAPPPERAAEHAELRAAFDQALQQLPEPFRTVLLLKDVELLTYAEIEGIVGANQKTISTRLHRARQRMRELLGEEWLEP